jgi:hypothetical protein
LDIRFDLARRPPHRRALVSLAPGISSARLTFLFVKLLTSTVAKGKGNCHANRADPHVHDSGLVNGDKDMFDCETVVFNQSEWWI